MTILIVLLASWLIFRFMGNFGFPAFLSWHDSAPFALAVMFLFASVAHFNRLRHDLVGMIPSVFPKPLAIVYLTGALEIAGAVGLMISRFRPIAAYCLIALLIAMFIANIHAARTGVTLGGKAVTPLWLRTPMQLLFLVLLWWSTRR